MKTIKSTASRGGNRTESDRIRPFNNHRSRRVSCEKLENTGLTVRLSGIDSPSTCYSAIWRQAGNCSAFDGWVDVADGAAGKGTRRRRLGRFPRETGIADFQRIAGFAGQCDDGTIRENGDDEGEYEPDRVFYGKHGRGALSECEALPVVSGLHQEQIHGPEPGFGDDVHGAGFHAGAGIAIGVADESSLGFRGGQ